MSSHPTDIHSRLWSRQNIRLSQSSVHCRGKSPNRLDSHSPGPCSSPRDRDISSQNNSACPPCRSDRRTSAHPRIQPEPGRCKQRQTKQTNLYTATSSMNPVKGLSLVRKNILEPRTRGSYWRER